MNLLRHVRVTFLRVPNMRLKQKLDASVNNSFGMDTLLTCSEQTTGRTCD
jgi:hypothetical protein